MPGLRRFAAMALTGAALATTVATAPQAAAAPLTSCAIGMIPLTNQTTWMREAPGFTYVLYTLDPGRGFRIGAGPVTADGLVWWFGHGNDVGQGWVPDQNLTCH